MALLILATGYPFIQCMCTVHVDEQTMKLIHMYVAAGLSLESWLWEWAHPFLY